MDGVLSSLVGLPISHARSGYGGTALFDLGTLQPYKTRKGNDSRRGEVSLMIECSWRVEKARSVWFGAFDSDRIIESRLAKLVGHTVEGATLEGRFPELRLKLSGGSQLTSFTCSQGDSCWVIFTRNHQYQYYAKAQRLYKVLPD